jgi:ABC-2 type transport system ATP-binding protein
MVGLDPRSVRIVKDLLCERTRGGMTVFMSTHTLAMAEELADRVGIMVRGRLRFLGTVADLRARGAGEATGIPSADAATTSLEQLYLDITSAGGHESPP